MSLPPTLEQIASCVSGYDPNALAVDAAQAFIARLVPRVGTIESIALRASLGGFLRGARQPPCVTFCQRAIVHLRRCRTERLEESGLRDTARRLSPGATTL